MTSFQLRNVERERDEHQARAASLQRLVAEAESSRGNRDVLALQISQHHEFVAALRQQLADLKHRLKNHPSRQRYALLWWRCETMANQLRRTQADLNQANSIIAMEQEQRIQELE